jgi:hypothetical protein
MQKLIVLIVLLGLLSLPLMAQDNPKVEVFGGWQYLHFGGDNSYIGNASKGWDSSLTANVNKHFGLTADFSDAYKTQNITSETPEGIVSANIHSHVYSYTFGPVVSMDSGGKINPFAHALFGGAHVTESGCVVLEEGSGCGLGSQNGFAMMLGGGVDVKANKFMALRIPQVDWVYYRFNGVGESKNVRISAGVVFRF